MKIVTVVGARPQFVKAAVVSRALRSCGGVSEHLVHTGQHYDAAMSDIFFAELGLAEPAHHLGVGSGPHGAQTGRMLAGIEAVLVDLRPDWMLVYGDTNSTLAAALAAAKLHVPVAHVEAGLRSFNRRMPEEVNRVLTDHVSALLFAPTDAAVANLEREGITGDRVKQVGDVMFDAARYYAARAQGTFLARHALASKSYVLATLHRAENTDDPARLAALVGGFVELARSVPVVLPLHPRTRVALTAVGALERLTAAVQVIPPIGYLEMTEALAHARLVATDSGGVQKEAFFFEVPCVTLREETEWVELVAWGWNTLCLPTSADAVSAGLRAALDDARPRHTPDDAYGGGRAGERIARALVEAG